MNWTESLPSGDIFEVTATQAWVIAALFFGLGDVVTTTVGLRIAGVSEANPFAAALFQHSLLLGMIVLKIAAFGVLYGLWKWIPHPHRAGVPLGLALFGLAVTAWNSHIVLLAVLQ